MAHITYTDDNIFKTPKPRWHPFLLYNHHGLTELKLEWRKLIPEWSQSISTKLRKKLFKS